MTLELDYPITRVLCLVRVLFEILTHSCFCLRRDWDDDQAHQSMCDSSRTTITSNLLTHGFVFILRLFSAFTLPSTVFFLNSFFWLVVSNCCLLILFFHLQLFMWVGQTDRISKHCAKYFLIEGSAFYLSTCKLPWFQFWMKTVKLTGEFWMIPASGSF